MYPIGWFSIKKWLATLLDAMRAYNCKILAYSSDQIMPVKRPFGGHWCDDATVPVPRQMIEDDRVPTLG